MPRGMQPLEDSERILQHRRLLEGEGEQATRLVGATPAQREQPEPLVGMGTPEGVIRFVRSRQGQHQRCLGLGKVPLPQRDGAEPVVGEDLVARRAERCRGAK